jgi:anthraniloyl-CoA monooxygenase
MDETASREYIEEVFKKDLEGNPLLSNRSSWLNFLLVKNEHWVYENAVLLGDACHTAHFSIGSGTKLALEDSIALFEELEKESDIKKALAQYEQNRKPIVQEYQEAAQKSLLLFEHLDKIIDLPPMEVAYRMMTRSARVTYDKIKKRDPEFGKRYDAFKAASQ